MKKLFFFSLFTLSLYAIEIKIASYNVENLFDMRNDGSEYLQYKPNKHNWNRQNYQKKLQNISEVICDIDSDIIALQEVENRNVLRDLQRLLREVGCSYRYSAITTKKESAIQVAVLSKLPIVASREIVVNYRLEYRNILELKYSIDGKSLLIYVNHWSSKKSKESRRVRSAKALKKRVLALPKDTDYILLGDFNSNYNEYKHLESRLNDTKGVVGINHILHTISNDKLVKEIDMKNSKKFQHYNSWLELANFQRWSHNFYGKKQGLDAILLPKSMFDGKGIDYVNDSFSVFKASYLFHKKGYINRWQYKNRRHLGEGYSDHLPIVATFSTKPYIFNSSRERVVEGNISRLYKKSFTNALYLKEVKVIFKSKYHAIIKQRKNGRAIFVYGAEDLALAKSYDLLIYKRNIYRGLHEIVNYSIEYNYGDVDIDPYYYKGELDFKNRALENELLAEVEGVYKQERLYINGKAYPIYFKKRALKPKDGSYLKLKKVQIGYHNRLQLVVWE